MLEDTMDRNKYRLGLYEKAIPDFDNWLRKLELTKESGFDWLEISIDESEKKQARLKYSQQQIAEIKNAVSASGVPIHTMCLSGHRKYPLGSRCEKTRARSLEIMKKAISLSAELGVRIIQLAGYDVYYEDHGSDTEKYFLDGLKTAVEMASEYGIVLGFETMETSFMDTTMKSMKYVDRINSPYLGVYPDIGNLKNSSLIYGTDVVDDLKAGNGHIFAAHLKETKPGLYRDMLFGRGGHTEYERCLEELWAQGVRMFTGEFWYHGSENYREDLLYAAGFLREKIDAVAFNHSCKLTVR